MNNENKTRNPFTDVPRSLIVAWTISGLITGLLIAFSIVGIILDFANRNDMLDGLTAMIGAAVIVITLFSSIPLAISIFRRRASMSTRMILALFMPGLIAMIILYYFATYIL